MSGDASLTPARHSGRQKAVLAALAALALVTVFLLPSLVREPWLLGEAPGAAVAPPTGSATVAPSTAAEKTRYRQESQTVLAQLIAVRDRLRGRGVEHWAAVEFNQALAQVTEGDARYEYGEYAQSLALYREALAVMERLEPLGEATLERAVLDGTAALEALNPNTATSSIQLAAAIAPQDARVQALERRLGVLPELAAAMEQGDQALALDRLDEAQAAYARATSLDPAHQRAAQALASARSGQQDAVFRQHMSRGYAAMHAGDFGGARAAFRAAAASRPGDPAPAQALAEVDNRAAQAGVTGRLEQARALEAAESWQAAVELYEALLAEDATLSEARARLLPAQVRAALDADLQRWIDDPLKLSNRQSWEQAQARVADASGIADAGPRLDGQVAQVQRLLQAAVSQFEVEFRSDNLTQVTVFRVADLGTFERQVLKLRPGRYIAAGTRKGYRDVRVEFTITGMEAVDPIVVRCEEPI